LRVSPAYARHAHSLDNRLSIRAGGTPILRRSNPFPGSGLTGSRPALDPVGPDGDLLGGQGATRLQAGVLVAPLLDVRQVLLPGQQRTPAESALRGWAAQRLLLPA